MSRTREVYERALATTDVNEALADLRAATELAQSEGDLQTLALSLLELGIREFLLGEPSAAGTSLQKALPLLDEQVCPAEYGACLYYLWLIEHDLRSARSDIAGLYRALALLEQGGEFPTAGDCCRDLADAVQDAAESDALFERALALYKKTETSQRAPHALYRWALRAIVRGDAEKAAECAERGLAMMREASANRNARKLKAELLELAGDAMIARARNTWAIAPELLSALVDAEVFYRESQSLFATLQLTSRAERVAAKLTTLPQAR